MRPGPPDSPPAQVRIVPASSPTPDSPSNKKASGGPEEVDDDGEVEYDDDDDEAWHSYSETPCCSLPCLGSVAGSFDSTSLEQQCAPEQQLNGLSALRTLATNKLAREPVDSVS